jgi:hypothetical protein
MLDGLFSIAGVRPLSLAWVSYVVQQTTYFITPPATFDANDAARKYDRLSALDESAGRHTVRD